MGRVWSFLNQKGGTGKTTSTANIGHCLMGLDAKVAFLDRDPQESLKDWGAIEGIFEVYDAKTKKIDVEISEYRERYDYILLDGAPRVDTGMMQIIKNSDLIIIPIQPSPVDYWAASDIIELIKLYHETSKGIPKVAYLITMSQIQTTLSKTIIPTLLESGFPILKQQMTRRELYKRSAEIGKTVFSTAPNEASREIDLIVKELLELDHEKT